MAAGVRGKNKRFPKGTLYHLVDERLRTMAERLRKQSEKPQGKRKRKLAAKASPSALTH